MPPKRYFDDLSDNIRPGVISDRLREAIGLDDDKLPIWIYRMRVLGYPPGWLKKADMSRTVIPLLQEAGQRQSDQQEESSTYNPDSLIKYPGFNAPVPDGVNDDHKLLRMPPLMQHQQLDFATSTMKTPKPVPYKRLKITSEAQSPDGESEKQDSESNSLTSKEILKQIEEREAANPSSSSASSPASKVVCTGAQVPESYKVKKPPLEKWSENNSLAELVFFENLPNYTGVFDRMRSVLGGVRTKLFGSQTSSSVSAAEQMSETKNQAAEVKTDTEPPVILLTDSDDDGKESDGEDDGKSDK